MGPVAVVRARTAVRDVHASGSMSTRALRGRQALPTFPAAIDTVFDRSTGALYRRVSNTAGWVRLTGWPSLEIHRRDIGDRRWRVARAYVEIHWPPRPELFEDADTPEQTLVSLDQRYLFGARAWGAWARRIPARVRQIVASFGSQHAPLLAWAAGGPLCADLLVTNPALAALAAHADTLGGLRRRLSVRTLQAAAERGRSQRSLLRLIDLPATEPARRLLQKVRPEGVTLDALATLVRVLTESAVRDRVQHLPRLTPSVLRLCGDPVALAQTSDAFLRWIGDDEEGRRPLGAPVPEYQPELAGYLCWRLARQRWSPARSFRAGPLEASWPYLLVLPGWVEPHEDYDALDRVLCEPPLPGTAIVPLRTLRDLIEEGRAMHHGVGRCGPEVEEGELVFYRILAPERATLRLAASEEVWSLSDIRGRANRRVSAKTWVAVTNWFNDVAEW